MENKIMNKEEYTQVFIAQVKTFQYSHKIQVDDFFNKNLFTITEAIELDGYYIVPVNVKSLMKKHKSYIESKYPFVVTPYRSYYESGCDSIRDSVIMLVPNQELKEKLSHLESQ